MKLLKENNYIEAARLLNIEVAAIKAVTEVEAKMTGFLPNGELVILYEPFTFGRATKHIFNNRTVLIEGIEYPLSLQGKYDRAKCRYGTMYIQHAKRKAACSLNATAANESCSWGMFQTMGFNYKECGYKDVFGMIADYHKGERQQLEAFCRYIQNRKLDKYLREKKWAEFARLYAGPEYKQNRHDVKLEHAYLNAIK